MKIKLDPDQEIVNSIREGLKRTGGYCPCRRERTEATKMCIRDRVNRQQIEIGGQDLLRRLPVCAQDFLQFVFRLFIGLSLIHISGLRQLLEGAGHEQNAGL